MITLVPLFSLSLLPLGVGWGRRMWVAGQRGQCPGRQKRALPAAASHRQKNKNQFAQI